MQLFYNCNNRTAHMFKVNNRNTRTRCEIYLNLYRKYYKRNTLQVSIIFSFLKLNKTIAFENPLNDQIWLAEPGKIYLSYLQGSRKQ